MPKYNTQQKTIQLNSRRARVVRLKNIEPDTIQVTDGGISVTLMPKGYKFSKKELKNTTREDSILFYGSGNSVSIFYSKGQSVLLLKRRARGRFSESVSILATQEIINKDTVLDDMIETAEKLNALTTQYKSFNHSKD